MKAFPTPDVHCETANSLADPRDPSKITNKEAKRSPYEYF